jgi:hypothetical protein
MPRVFLLGHIAVPQDERHLGLRDGVKRYSAAVDDRSLTQDGGGGGGGATENIFLF